MDGGAVPFNTQFFHDDYDDGPGFDDVDPYDGDGIGVPDTDAGEQDLLAATQGQTRRARPEFVNYAKRAKRVDVRKLKDNIWRGLDIVVAPTKKDDEEDESMVGSLSTSDFDYPFIFDCRMWMRGYLIRRTPLKLASLARSFRVYRSHIHGTRWKRLVLVSALSASCILRTNRGSSLSPR